MLEVYNNDINNNDINENDINGNDINVNDINVNENDDRSIIKGARKYFSRMGFRLILGVVALIGVCFGAEFIVFSLHPELYYNYTSNLLVSVIPQYLIAMPLMAFIISYRMPKKAPEKRKAGFGWCVAFFMIAYAVMITSNLVATIVNMIISSFFKSSVSTYALMDYVQNADINIVVLVTVVCAPIFEEMIFRKLLIDRCGAYGQAASALVSGLAFGLFHGNLNQAVYAFCLGYFFALIYSKTGKIYITIGIHMVINFLGSFVAIKVVEMANIGELEALIAGGYSDTDALKIYLERNGTGLGIYVMYLFMVLAFIIAGIILLIVNRKKFIPERNGINLPRHSTFKTVMFNPGMIVFWSLMLVYIAYNFVSGLEI